MAESKKFAYADPPYIGQAKKHYNCKEIDHEQLLKKLMTFDMWALSCSSPSLKTILPMCPDTSRVGAWVKPFCIFKPNVNPAYSWEPVIFYNPRKRDRTVKTVRDHLSCNITLKKGLVGAKPREFCFWLFNLMGLLPEDEVIDLFPGTGIVTECWRKLRGSND